VTYTIIDNVTWLSLSPTNGSSTGEHDTINVIYSTSSLAAGYYSATITITASGAGAIGSPQTIPVSLTVGQPAISRSPTSLSSICQLSENASSQSFEVWNSGGGALSYEITDDADWLSCSPASGASTGEHDPITVTYNTSALPAGNYSAIITITDPAASNSPQTVSVSLTLGMPTISRAPDSLVNSCLQGQNAVSQSFEVWNSAGGTLSYTMTDSVTWLSLSPTNGSSTGEHDTINVIYSTSALAAGNYLATVTITATGSGATNTPQTIPVSLTVGQPAISRSPTSLSRLCQEGEDAGAQSFEVWNSGGGTLSYTITDDADWLSCSPSDGTSTSEHDSIVVMYDTSGLVTGSYSATITIADPSATNNPQTIPVNLTVNPVVPAISRSPASLSNSCLQGQNAPSQSFAVWNSGGGTLSYTMTDNVSWLSLSPTSGSSTGEHDTISVIYSTSSLAAGNYSATITINATGATNTPQTIPVSLTVGQPAISRSPTSLSSVCQLSEDALSQSFEVWNSGGSALSYTITDDVDWLSCSPASGSSTGEHDIIAVVYDTSSLSPGNYSATITVSDPAASNSPQTIAVSLRVGLATISRIPVSLANSCLQGQNAPTQSFEVWNSGGGTLSYSMADNVSWLSLSPTSGSSTGEHDTINVIYTTSALAAGNYSATITINATGATNTPQMIAVSLTVGQPSISRNPASLSNLCQLSEDALSQSFEVWNSGGGALSYTITDDADWLSCSPANGTSTSEHDAITVVYDTSSLPAGNYSATITVSDPAASNNPQAVAVSLRVGLATISRAPASLANSCLQGQNAPTQSFEVWNSGGGTLSYSMADNVSWLSLSPTSGSSTGEHDIVNVVFNTSTLSVGNYSATITITSAGATNTPQTIPVSLAVGQPAISRSPTSLEHLCRVGENASSQAFEVWNSGGGVLSYTITDDVDWLSCSPASGASTGEHDPIAVTYNTSALPAGDYSATITISDPASSNDPQTIPVSLKIGLPTISRTPASLVNSCLQGQNAPTQSFEVWNSGGGTLSYTISDDSLGLSCSPTSGSSTGEHDIIDVNYSTLSLPAGTYTATITISSPSATNSPQTISVNLSVISPTPTICADPISITSSCAQGENAPSQAFEVWNCGGDTLSYTLSDNATWVLCSPTNGDSVGEHDTITVNFASAGLAPGIYSATITITGNATNSPFTIPVSLTVSPANPAVSGYVRTSLGAGISNVAMNGLPGDPLTDASGYYEASVPYGWSGTVTPGKPGYLFDPPSISYSNVISDQTDQNYSGIQEVSLTLVPDSTTIPRGGTLGYTVIVTNNAASSKTFKYWTDVNLPNGSKYPPSGELFGPVTVTLNPFASRSAHLTRPIPLTAPLGIYVYNGYIGAYPIVMNEDHFEFRVVTSP